MWLPKTPRCDIHESDSRGVQVLKIYNPPHFRLAPKRVLSHACVSDDREHVQIIYSDFDLMHVYSKKICINLVCINLVCINLVYINLVCINLVSINLAYNNLVYINLVH